MAKKKKGFFTKLGKLAKGSQKAKPAAMPKKETSKKSLPQKELPKVQKKSEKILTAEGWKRRLMLKE